MPPGRNLYMSVSTRLSMVFSRILLTLSQFKIVEVSTENQCAIALWILFLPWCFNLGNCNNDLSK